MCAWWLIVEYGIICWGTPMDLWSSAMNWRFYESLTWMFDFHTTSQQQACEKQHKDMQTCQNYWMGLLSVTHTNKLWSWKNDDKWSSFFSTTAVWLTTIWLNSVIYNKAIRSEQLTKSIHCSKYRNHSWPQEMWNNIHNFRAHQYRTKCLLYERGVLWVCHIQDSSLLISRTSCPTWTLN